MNQANHWAMIAAAAAYARRYGSQPGKVESYKMNQASGLWTLKGGK